VRSPATRRTRPFGRREPRRRFLAAPGSERDSRLATSVALVLAFVAIELRSRAPLLPLRIFRLRTLSAANATIAVVGAGAFSEFFLLTLYMQDVLRFSPVQTGAAFAALALATVVASNVAQAVVGRVGVRPVLTSGLLALSLSAALLSRLPVEGHYFWDLFPAFLLGGVGLGVSFVSATIGSLTGVRASDSGVASGLVNTSRQIGGAIGLAAVSAVAAASTSSYVDAHPEVQASSALALTHGFQIGFYVLTGLLLFGALIAATLVKPRPASEHDLLLRSCALYGGHLSEGLSDSRVLALDRLPHERSQQLHQATRLHLGLHPDACGRAGLLELEGSHERHLASAAPEDQPAWSDRFHELEAHAAAAAIDTLERPSDGERSVRFAVDAENIRVPAFFVANVDEEVEDLVRGALDEASFSTVIIDGDPRRSRYSASASHQQFLSRPPGPSSRLCLAEGLSAPASATPQAHRAVVDATTSRRVARGRAQ
jgi:MFS family permease